MALSSESISFADHGHIPNVQRQVSQCDAAIQRPPTLKMNEGGQAKWGTVKGFLCAIVSSCLRIFQGKGTYNPDGWLLEGAKETENNDQSSDYDATIQPFAQAAGEVAS